LKLVDWPRGDQLDGVDGVLCHDHVAVTQTGKVFAAEYRLSWRGMERRSKFNRPVQRFLSFERRNTEVAKGILILCRPISGLDSPKTRFSRCFAALKLSFWLASWTQICTSLEPSRTRKSLSAHKSSPWVTTCAVRAVDLSIIEQTAQPLT
jgi:hypothetical protein